VQQRVLGVAREVEQDECDHELDRGRQRGHRQHAKAVPFGEQRRPDREDRKRQADHDAQEDRQADVDGPAPSGRRDRTAARRQRFPDGDDPEPAHQQVKRIAASWSIQAFTLLLAAVAHPDDEPAMAPAASSSVMPGSDTGVATVAKAGNDTSETDAQTAALRQHVHGGSPLSTPEWARRVDPTHRPCRGGKSLIRLGPRSHRPALV
jgi:hypothetical protein